MTNDMYRIGVVGASSLVGKELSEELASSSLAASDFVLLDVEDAVGQIATAADEVSFIQRLETSSFDRMDFVFFAGEAATTREHWHTARRAGASIVDLTYALEGEKGVPVRAPWVAEALAGKTVDKLPDLNTPAVVAAHPVAVMLTLVAGRLQAKLALTSVAAAGMEPASEFGGGAREGLHKKTG